MPLFRSVCCLSKRAMILGLPPTWRSIFGMSTVSVSSLAVLVYTSVALVTVATLVMVKFVVLALTVSEKTVVITNDSFGARFRPKPLMVEVVKSVQPMTCAVLSTLFAGGVPPM